MNQWLRFDRFSTTTARAVVEEIYPSKKTRIAACRILAESITAAHASGETSWSVTLFEKIVRLNVGPVEVAVLDDLGVYVIVLTDSLEQQVRTQLQPFLRTQNRYRSMSAQHAGYELPIKSVQALYALLREHHHAYIRNAARARKSTSYRKSMSPGLVWYLNELLDVELPLPAYLDFGLDSEGFYPDEAEARRSYREGAVRQVEINAYERNEQARKRCIAVHGSRCVVCDFNFEEKYGEFGAGFIHVHHLRPLSSVQSDYIVDPSTDMRPVCPNCHAMIHRRGDPISIEELRAIMKQASG